MSKENGQGQQLPNGLVAPPGSFTFSLILIPGNPAQMTIAASAEVMANWPTMFAMLDEAKNLITKKHAQLLAGAQSGNIVLAPAEALNALNKAGRSSLVE